MTQEKELQSARYGFWGYLILIIGLAGITAFLLFINQDALFKYGLTYRQIWSVWGGVFGFLFLGSVCSPFYWRWKQRKKQLIYLPPDSSGAEAKTNPDVITIIDYTDLKQHLNLRYRVFWRRKVRLLLITGDEAAIEQLLPGLQQQQWLEGNRTVLIYGGSLASEPDREKYIALRKLRRGCPLDGIKADGAFYAQTMKTVQPTRMGISAGLWHPGCITPGSSSAVKRLITIRCRKMRACR